MRSRKDQLRQLSLRAERAFRVSTPTEVIAGRKAIVGPLRLDLLTRDAEDARQLLLHGGAPSARQLASLEQAIRLQRPAPACRRDDLTPLPNEGNWLSQEWSQFQPKLKRLQGSVARLERVDDPDPSLGSGRTNLGTGFLVASDMLLTAAHVVDGLSFSTGVLERGQAVADFAGYSRTSGIDLRAVIEVIDVDLELDLALLSIEAVDLHDASRPALLPAPLPPTPGKPIYVVGYPLADPRNPSVFVDIIFGMDFGIKRAAVGEIIAYDSMRFFHDCTTLGGNSGSPVIDLATGRVLGVHTSGRAMMRNEATRGEPAHRFVARSRKSESSPPSPRRNTPMKNSRPSFDEFYQELRESDPELRGNGDRAGRHGDDRVDHGTIESIHPRDHRPD